MSTLIMRTVAADPCGSQNRSFFPTFEDFDDSEFGSTRRFSEESEVLTAFMLLETLLSSGSGRSSTKASQRRRRFDFPRCWPAHEATFAYFLGQSDIVQRHRPRSREIEAKSAVFPAFTVAESKDAKPPIPETVAPAVDRGTKRISPPATPVAVASVYPDLGKAFGPIKGTSDAINKAKLLAFQSAQTESGVLLLGETGTGKELFARAIHDSGPRAAKPFVAINCAAIPDALFESAMFGNEKGAFTGATEKRVGAFRTANCGTIFLDEVGDINLENQAKLLRVLQSKKGESPCHRGIMPVGAVAEIRVDVRVIAATNAKLWQAVNEGRFREDLYHRLRKFPIKLPPLRERAGDVKLLAEVIMNRINQERSKLSSNYLPKKLNAAAHARLQEGYLWPGNVRELESLLEYVVARTAGTIIIDEHAIDTAIAELAEDDAAGPFRRVRGPDFGLEKRLDDMERIYIEDALNDANGNKAEAAALLGLKSTAFVNSKIKALERRKRKREAARNS